jgi:hypothetical protein
LEAASESTIAYEFGHAPAKLKSADEITQSLILAPTQAGTLRVGASATRKASSTSLLLGKNS